MYASMHLHPQFSVKELRDLHQLPACCTLLLQDARQLLYTGNRGSLFLQFLPHYLVHIELLEYDISKDTNIGFSLSKSSFIMLAMLSGHSILSDEQGNVLTETHGNCCYLSYFDCGKYYRTFLTGHHKLLVLHINPDFILQHAERLPELQPLIRNYLLPQASYFSLAQAPIARGIFNLLKKLSQFQHKHTIDYDKKVMSFLIESLNSYQTNLGLRNITSMSQQDKAEEVAVFIAAHFLAPIVNHKAQMALHFCVSEKTMLRLAKRQFGMSLHQKVIELRLVYSLKQLQSTSKSVQQIADLIGYDRHYFSKAFKRQFGISPAQIRKPDQQNYHT